MVKVSHVFGDVETASEAENPSFILTNKGGSYLYLGLNPESRYQGFFIFDNFHMFRTIESINIPSCPEITSLRNHFYCIERLRECATERFFVPHGLNSMVYEIDNAMDIEIVLDAKEIYDNRVWGRNYEIYTEGCNIIIQFTKKTDSREDSSGGREEYSLYMVIRSDGPEIRRIGEWSEHVYSLDAERNSPPFRRHVYRALMLRGKSLVFTCSNSRNDAVKECNYVFENLRSIRRKEQQLFNSGLRGFGSIKDQKIRMAFLSALNSLDSLGVSRQTGILAGLPWFFQFWSRDTAISLKGAPISTDAMKKILFDILATLNASGKVSNIYAGERSESATTADSAGWVFFRLYELYKKKSLNRRDIAYTKPRLLDALLAAEKKAGAGLLVPSKGQETWMDTVYKNDSRAGARIEIQSLYLSMFRFAYDLTKNNLYREKERLLASLVREKLWDGAMMADGLGDFTSRPNIFIAAYIYPEILTAEQWAGCLARSLASLWLEWGGLSTIDRSNPLFSLEHTGENNISYHRGDSWFWLNNLAAIVLLRLDKARFGLYINKILQASTQEILFSGAIGHHAELSSASRLRSQGCIMQAWSAAMYVELVREIYNV